MPFARMLMYVDSTNPLRYKLIQMTGLHCLLNPSGSSLSSQRSQSQESQDKGLPRQGSTGCRIGPQSIIGSPMEANAR